MTNITTVITLESTIERNSADLLTSEVGDEMVMMDIEAGNYISLNKIGRVIWEHIEQPIKVGDLIDNLINRFNVDRAQCTTDTLEYLNNMLVQKTIKVI
jgi:hypothetical protein